MADIAAFAASKARGRISPWIAVQPDAAVLVIGGGSVLEDDAAGAQTCDGVVVFPGRSRDVQDALAAIEMQIFLDVRFVVGRFVDGSADVSAGARHRPRFEAG